MPRAALQPDVGKPAGGGADVERNGLGRINPEGLEGMRELDAAAADPRMIGTDHAQVGVDGTIVPAFAAP